MDTDEYCASLKKTLQDRGILVRRLVPAPAADATFWLRHPNGKTTTWHVRGSAGVVADVAAILGRLEGSPPPERGPDSWEGLEDEHGEVWGQAGASVWQGVGRRSGEGR